MVLAAIIPTADGEVWQTGRFALATLTRTYAAGRQSSRLAGKSGAAATECATGGERTPGASAASNTRVPCVGSAGVSTSGRKEKGGREKGGKRKRDEEAAEKAAVQQDEAMTGKYKKEHDKYCHFCQVGSGKQLAPFSYVNTCLRRFVAGKVGWKRACMHRGRVINIHAGSAFQAVGVRTCCCVYFLQFSTNPFRLSHILPL